MTRTEPIRLAFIGSGNWAQTYHFPALDYARRRANVELRGLYSLDLESAQRVAKRYEFAQVYAALDALLADEGITAIAVAVTPNALFGVLNRIIARKLPIFSEKPPGVSVEQAQLLSTLITVPNVLAFNRRFVPLNNTFKNIVQQMNGIYFVEGHFFRHNRQDEAFMIGTGIHWINYMAYLFGNIADVAVDKIPNPQNQTWGRVAHLTFESGLKGVFKVFPCSGSQVEQIEAHSNAQSAYLYGPLWQYPGKIVIERGTEQEVIAPEATEPLPEIVRLGIVGEYEEFFQVVRGETKSRSTFQNAVNSMRIAALME